MNLSETAFVRQMPDAKSSFSNGSEFGLRWFTPSNEVNLCGHATLATAAVLFNILGNQSDTITFHSLSGKLVAMEQGDMISLNFPANPPESIERESVKDLLKCAVGDMNVQGIMYSPATKKLLVRLKDNYSRTDLEQLKPKIDEFMKAEPSGRVSGVILTLRGDGERNGCVDDQGRAYDFVSRYFAPWNGIPEDPVTGAAHTVLTPYWSEQLGKKEMYARQCSKRGGELYVRLRDDGRVDLTGYATPVLQGTIRY